MALNSGALTVVRHKDIYNNLPAKTKSLEIFFDNLLLNTGYALKNRYAQVEADSKSIISKAPKSQFDTLDCTLEELSILELVAKNPVFKRQEFAEATGKSIATVKRVMKSLQGNNYFRR